MDLSWAALTFILVFITPTLPLIFLFRILYPKTRTIKLNETSIFLLCGVMSLIANWPLAGLMIRQQLEPGGFLAALRYTDELFLFIDGIEYSPIRVAPTFIKLLFTTSELIEKNVFALLLDFQIRPSLIFGTVVFAAKAIALADQYFDALPFIEAMKEPPPIMVQCFRKICRFVATGFGYSTRPIPKDQRRPDGKRALLTKWINYFQEGLYHPWSLLTEFNKFKEFLMVDVVTRNGDLFSGVFTTVVPSEDSISAIAIMCPIHFFPEKLDDQGPQRNDVSLPLPMTPLLNSNRKIRLVRNQGELVILGEEIRDIHFWEIRRGIEIEINVYNRSSLELLKWNLKLLALYPSFFGKLDIRLVLKTGEIENYLRELRGWAEACEIDVPEDKAKFQIFEVDETSPIVDQTET